MFHQNLNFLRTIFVNLKIFPEFFHDFSSFIQIFLKLLENFSIVRTKFPLNFSQFLRNLLENSSQIFVNSLVTLTKQKYS